MNRRVRILVAEDHATVREGLKLLISHQADMEVIAEASNGEEALRLSSTDHPDVVLMDLSMPGMGGLVATRRLKELCPDVAVVTLTRHADQAFLQELLRAGASGYVLKQSPHTELLHAIRAVASGRQYVDSTLTRHLAAPFVGADPRKGVGGAFTPTPRELEVLRLGAQGHSNKEIAAQLGVSVKTVEVHKANAMRKLGISGRIELLQYAVLQGWLDSQ